MYKKSLIVLIFGAVIAYLINAKLKPRRLSDGASLSLPVKTESGILQGFTLKARNNREFAAFLGIPYAEPPVGDLRFESPHPAKKWPGVRNATEFGNECLQVQQYKTTTKGVEDCLYLNVYTAHKLEESEVTKNLYPVLVWIHGGLFVYGSSNLYLPNYFLEHGVVLVTINYRLGPFGFLSTDDGNVRGNMGLKDQVVALKWVQQNIRNFGGNPKRVTIFGESAGGASVHYHKLSPMSKGLFSAAISQSGVTLNPWAHQPNPKKQAERLAQRLNCTSSYGMKEVVKCLKQVPAETLAQATSDVNEPLKNPLSAFVPTVEKVKDEQAFITEHPSSLLQSGKANLVPWINGVNSHEGLVITTTLFTQSLLSQFSSDLKLTFANILWFTTPPSSVVLERTKQFYLGNDNIHEHTMDKFHNWTNMITDTYFNVGHHETIKLYAHHQQKQDASNSKRASPIYLYFYTYEAKFSLGEILFALKGRLPLVLEYIAHFGWRWIQQNLIGRELSHLGSSHFDEVSLLFPLGGIFNTNVDADHPDFEMSQELVKSWVNFAKDSNNLHFRGKPWPKFETSHKPLLYLKVDREHEIVEQPFHDRMKFWESLQV